MATAKNGKAKAAEQTEQLLPTEVVEIADLKEHPRNYRGHPDDQIAQIVQSIKDNGVYRPVVVAKEGTILAGHGVVKALKVMGHTTVPIIRLNILPGDPRALKVLTGDNEISGLGERDDRLLSELLKQIKDEDINGLLGTGFDEMMLANLVFVTRPESEIQDFNAAAEWAGMPEYQGDPKAIRLVISFDTPEARVEFCSRMGIEASGKRTMTAWWPPKERNDLSSVRFEEQPQSTEK